MRLGFRYEDREDVRPYGIRHASVIDERSVHYRHAGNVTAVRYRELESSGSGLRYEEHVYSLGEEREVARVGGRSGERDLLVHSVVRVEIHGGPLRSHIVERERNVPFEYHVAFERVARGEDVV